MKRLLLLAALAAAVAVPTATAATINGTAVYGGFFAVDYVSQGESTVSATAGVRKNQWFNLFVGTADGSYVCEVYGARSGETVSCQLPPNSAGTTFHIEVSVSQHQEVPVTITTL